jgi:hypothetical protein
MALPTHPNVKVIGDTVSQGIAHWPPAYLIKLQHAEITRSRTCINKASTIYQGKQTGHLSNNENSVAEYQKHNLHLGMDHTHRRLRYHK